MFAIERRVIRQAAVLAILALSVATAAAQPHRGQPRSLSPEERQKAIEAIDALIEQVKADKTIAHDKMDQAASIISRAVRALPPDQWLARAAALQQHRSDAAIPTRRKPLHSDKKLDRLILHIQVSALKAVAPEKMPAHPCADEFPGPVPDDAKRVSRQIEIKTDVPGWHNHGIYGHPDSPYWHSTGLYAAPGEVVTVTVPGTATDKGLHVRIGCHADRLWHHKSWRRPPEICARYPIVAERTRAANAFGGLIYIESPRDASLPAFQITIDGAVQAPYYVHGVTSVKQWRSSIRNHPAPWAELQGKRIILTLPAADVRKLDDPNKLMDFWDGVMDLYAELLGRSPQRRRLERFVPDVQLSAGYMHSGYPLMTMLDITGTMVDIERIKANRHHGIWGLFHEIGHNHQSHDWTFHGTTEVTVNLFSLYVMEKVCGLPIGGHGCVTPEWRAKRMKRYFDGGTKFDEWKSDPFLALAMYIELQQKFGWAPFTKVFCEYRALPADQRPKTDDQRRDQWMVRFSKRVGRNLGPFFQAWGVPTSETARKSIKDLPVWMPTR